jgi:hypothetical protein
MRGREGWEAGNDELRRRGESDDVDDGWRRQQISANCCSGVERDQPSCREAPPTLLRACTSSYRAREMRGREGSADLGRVRETVEHAAMDPKNVS